MVTMNRHLASYDAPAQEFFCSVFGFRVIDKRAGERVCCPVDK
jgi:hypothetical protein